MVSQLCRPQFGHGKSVGGSVKPALMASSTVTGTPSWRRVSSKRAMSIVLEILLA